MTNYQLESPTKISLCCFKGTKNIYIFSVFHLLIDKNTFSILSEEEQQYLQPAYYTSALLDSVPHLSETIKATAWDIYVGARSVLLSRLNSKDISVKCRNTRALSII